MITYLSENAREIGRDEQQGYLVLRIFQNRDLLKVNPKTVGGECLNGIHTVDLAVS